jgi:hypothetical protein
MVAGSNTTLLVYIFKNYAIGKGKENLCKEPLDAAKASFGF